MKGLADHSTRAAPPPRIVDAVFARPEPRRGRAVATAVGVAVLVHLGFWGWARHREPSLESWSAELAARIHAELGRRAVIDVLPPPPPPSESPPPPPPPPSASARPAPAAPRARPAASEPRAAPPAAAGAIVAAAPAEPVDLTRDTFVTGGATAYAGGATTSSGTNQAAGPPGAVDPRARPTARAGGADRSRAVALDGDEWRCAWPREADAAQIDQQWVVLRVRVRRDGRAASARLVSDPGHGFGRAAVACALSTRFEPARDADGDAIEADSPPIRVRFTR